MPRVLVVDDNEDAADTLAQLLILESHEVKVAYDGAVAVEMAQEFPADVAIIEIGVRTIDGYVVARWLKRLRPGVRLIAMTRATLDCLVEVRHAGFSCALTKPFPIRALLDAMMPAGA